MAKYKLRESFSIDLPNGDFVNGPAEVELDEKTANENIHKLEELDAKKSPTKKKEKEAE